MAQSTTPETPAWAAALGRIPSGLFIVTVRHGEQETGMLASWVQQCSFDPPLVSVAVKSGRYVLDWLRDGATFTINVIPEGQKSLIAHFGKGFEPGESAFSGIGIERSDTGGVHLTDSLACLDGRVVSVAETGGDHALVIGQVLDGCVRQEGRPTVHVRRSGLHY